MSSVFRPLVLFPFALALGVSLAGPSASAAPRSRDGAQALIAEVEKSPAARGAAREALAEAKRAMVRAERARLANDHVHGAKLEDLAFEWAQAARDLARNAEANERAAALERKLKDTDSKLDRAHTLIEQTNARRARAEAQLKELEAAPTAAPATGKAAPAKAPQAPGTSRAPSSATSPASPPVPAAGKPVAPAPSAKKPTP